jgi:hypothetical protein
MGNVLTLGAIVLVANVLYAGKGIQVSFANTSEAQIAGAYLLGIVLIAGFLVGATKYLLGLGGGDGGGHGGH